MILSSWIIYEYSTKRSWFKTGCLDRFGDDASLNGDLAGLCPAWNADTGTSKSWSYARVKDLPIFFREGTGLASHHMEKDPEISNIQLVKLTKSICFPYDNYTACGSWKFSVQRLPSPLALGNETWFSIKMREEQFILLQENARESEAPTAS